MADPAPNPDPTPVPDADPAPNPAPDPTPSPDPAPAVNLFAQPPETWREDWAGEDEKAKNILDRYGDPSSVLKGLIEAKDTIRSGSIAAMQPPGEGANDSDWAEYRETMGIPETAEGYTPPEGVVLGEADQLVASAVYEYAHANHLPAETVAGLVGVWSAQQQELAQQMELKEQQDKSTCEQALKNLWRGEYEANLNAVNGEILAKMPETLRESFSDAVLPDGTNLFNSPEAVQFFAQIAKQLNPLGTVLPDSANPMGDAKNRMAEIEKIMGTPEYTTEMREEYTKLTKATMS